jgi:predicted NBD/HSP70 family sugar kinase
VSTAGDFMLNAIRDRVDELTVMVPRRTTQLVIAQLGNDAGQVGAATMAFRGGLITLHGV